MRPPAPVFKPIVAAGLLLWLSAPLPAQEAPAGREADLLRQLAEAEAAALEQLKEENPEAYRKRDRPEEEVAEDGEGAVDKVLVRADKVVEDDPVELALDGVELDVDEVGRPADDGRVQPGEVARRTVYGSVSN